MYFNVQLAYFCGIYCNNLSHKLLTLTLSGNIIQQSSQNLSSWSLSWYSALFAEEAVQMQTSEISLQYNK